MTDETTLFAALGGEEVFNQVVHAFYQRVKTDDILGPMYPADDWEGAEARLRWFLMQYWGGPSTYSEQRGHPRLRMRHHPFTIDRQAAERWLSLMSAAIDEVDIDPTLRAPLWDHMERVAMMLINKPEN